MESDKIADLVKGIAAGCKQAGAALIGGETAEMPGFYDDKDYDMAGFTVGIVEKDQIITGEGIQAGHVLVGLPSSGIHSNGYSLVRKLLFDHLSLSLEDTLEGLDGNLGDALIEPTKIYVQPVLKALETVEVKGMVHVTGGGFIENIPRVLPEGLGAEIKLGTWPQLSIFKAIENTGLVDQRELYKTFNMGIGFIMIVKQDQVESLIKSLKACDQAAFEIGRVTNQEGIVLC